MKSKKNGLYILLVVMLLSCETLTRIKDEVVSMYNLAFEQPVILDPESEMFKEIDYLALHTPASAETSISSLAAYLTKEAKNDWEKIRAIYIWITDNISYDVKAYFSGNYGSQLAEDVLRIRKCVCEGYANLFEFLARAAGLDIVKITGFAKGYGYSPGTPITSSNHAWNGVKLEGRLHLFDPTWGAGGITPEGKYVKKLEDYWFDVDPGKMIYSHLPDNPDWQALDTPISREQFESMPEVPRALFALGFTETEIFAELQKKDFKGFPQVYFMEGNRVAKVHLPLSGVLKKNESFDLKLVIQGAIQAAMSFNGRIYDKMGKIGDNYYYRYIALKEGRMKICAEYANRPGLFYTIIEYEIREY